MAHRALVKIVITGTRVLGHAFAEAYRQAAAQSAAKQGASAMGRNKTEEVMLLQNMAGLHWMRVVKY